MAAAARARALRAEGRDIVSLTLGEPGFATPPHIVEAAYRAARDGETKYPPIRGTPALLAAVREKFQRENKLDFSPDQVIVGHGARQIIYDALAATLEPGCEIVIPSPYWNAYPLIARMLGAVPVFVECDEAAGFLPDPEALAAAITPRTRWLVLNFPSNPTGAVCPPSHLARIAEALRPHRHVWILSDDIYEHLIHDGAPNPTIAAIAPDLADRTLTVSGVSKTYAMTGWRIGFAGGPARLLAAMARVQGQSTGGVSPIAQAAAVAALTGDQSCVADMRRAYAERAALFAEAFGSIPGLRCPRPAGAFYLYPRIDLLPCRTQGGRRLATDADFAEALLEEAGVATVHGAAFGRSPHLRLSVAAEPEALEAAHARTARFCAALDHDPRERF